MADLERDEQDLLDSFEQGEWRTVPDAEGEKRRYIRGARSTLQKDKRINIRLTAPDLEALQARALEEGIPYQTLAASVLHKYVSGRLTEKERAKGPGRPRGPR